MTPTQLDVTDVLADVESFLDVLPKRRRTRAEIDESDDLAPETENYGGIDPAAVSIRCDLTHEDQITLILALWELGRARTEDERGTICRKIWAMVGLSCDLPSYVEALERRLSAAATRRKGGAQ